MGKSSSRNKVRSKTSLSQRSRRKSRSSRKLKSKKLRYHHDSPSCTDTDFESSTSVSSSSSEDDKMVRKSRSKTQKNVKLSKTRAKKQSRDRRSSRDFSPHSRKRKHSKRGQHCEVKKKKKRRRDVCVSSTSSDSLSYSTCGDGSTIRNESEIDRPKGGFRKRKGNTEKTKRNRYRSKSHSSCSLHSEGSDHRNEVEDDCYVENNFRRLRSVIVMVGEENKLEKFDGNEQQEEVTNQPDDDHPSSFGDMDSKDGTTKRHFDYVVLKEAPEVENNKEVVIPDNINSMVANDDGDENEGSNNNHGRATNDQSLNERKNSSSENTDSINCVDLESVLRQRALENLRKFKQVPPRNVDTPANCKVDNNNDGKQLYSHVSNSVQATSPRDEAEINGNRFSRQGGGNEAIGSAALASMHDPVYSSQNLGKITNESNGMNELKQDIASLKQEVEYDNICQKAVADADICPTTNRSNLVIAACRPETKVDSFTRQTSASQEPIQTKTSTIPDIGVDETSQTQTHMRNNDYENIGNGNGNGFGRSSAHEPSSSLNSISGENSLNKSRHESGESSQFEQKTMSVMRGGEMVQVNYKVYIPKRAPALTRRQLKR